MPKLKDKKIRIKSCEYCFEDFKACRRNQKYCSNSCRTQACYDRNKYEYQSGRYLKSKDIIERKAVENLGEISLATSPSSTVIKKNDSSTSKISVGGVANAALGSGLVKMVEHVMTAPDEKTLSVKQAREMVQGLLHVINHNDRLLLRELKQLRKKLDTICNQNRNNDLV